MICLAHTRSDKRCTIRPRRGTAMVELLVVLPLLVAVCLLSVDLARSMHLANALSNAARVGAERGATRQFTDYTRVSWQQLVEQSVLDEMQDLVDFVPSQLAIELTVDDADESHVRVVVLVEYEFYTVLPWPGLPRPLTIRRSVAMRQYR